MCLMKCLMQFECVLRGGSGTNVAVDDPNFAELVNFKKGSLLIIYLKILKVGTFEYSHLSLFDMDRVSFLDFCKILFSLLD